MPDLAERSAERIVVSSHTWVRKALLPCAGRIFVWVAVFALGCSALPASAGTGTDARLKYKAYMDPARRFALDYPSTMKVETVGVDSVTISLPAAAFRITVFIAKRPKARSADAKPLLDALKKSLKIIVTDLVVLEEGRLPGESKAQGYVIFSFKNSRGVSLTQLVHYYVSRERTLQLTISDRSEGFKNLEKIIRKIHGSLRILDRDLK